VLGVGRRVLGDAQQAEDVFQATWLVLARKAASLRRPDTLAAWLHGTARRLALRCRRADARRRQRETRGLLAAPAPRRNPLEEVTAREVLLILDEEIQRLPEACRMPLVLCCLEGHTQEEAARLLGRSAGSIKGGLERGRKRLSTGLARRGLTLSAALGVAAAQGMASGVPPLVGATTKAALAFRATGVATPAVRSLLGGVPPSGKLAAGLAGLVLACVCAVGLARRGPDAASPEPPAAARADGRGQAEPTADALGDPLPVGAVARLGTLRLCGFGQPLGALFSPDGTKVASKSLFGLEVWDAATGRALLQRGPDYEVAANQFGWRADGTAVAVIRLPDQSFFVSAFTDAAEKVPTPAQVWPPVIPNPYLPYLALSPDAARLAAVRDPDAKEFTIDLLPATTGQPVAKLKAERTLGPFPGPCRDVRYTAAGQLVTLHGDPEKKGDWSVAVIDPDKKTVVRTSPIPAPGYCPYRYMLTFSADGRLAAVAPRTRDYPNDHDRTVRVWDLTEGKQLCSVPFPNEGYGIGHAFTPDGKRLITSAGEPFFQVWDVKTGKEVGRSPPSARGFHAMEAAGVAVSPDGKRFATARRDGRVGVWDTATLKPVVSLATHGDAVDAVAVSPDGRLAATLSADDSIRVWDLATGKPGCVIPAGRGKDSARRYGTQHRLAFTPDGRGLLFATEGGLALADPITGKPLDLPGRVRGRRGEVGGFAADGKTLATFAADAVTLWEWPAGTVRTTVTVVVDPGGPAAPKGDPEIAAVRSAALSPDGRLLFTNSVRRPKANPAAGGYHNANDVWDGRTGRHLRRLTTIQTWYPPAAFAPDGRVLYLGGHSVGGPRGGRDRADALTAWDPAAGKLLRRFVESERDESRPGFDKEFGRKVDAVAVSPDGRLLATSEGAFSGDASVWLYEAATARLLKKLTGHRRQVTDLAFTPDGRRLVSVSQDQTGLVWDVTLPALGGAEAGKPTDARLAEAWDRLDAPDPRLAYIGMATLAAAPAEAVPFLRTRLRPAPVPGDADLDRLVRQLDAEAFEDREKASAELERFGPNAVAGVKARLEKVTSKEVRARLSRFLGRYEGPEPSPYHLRFVRGVAVLEALGRADARSLLAELAKGPADDVLAREAREAIRRFGSR
jgi:RNA polymerase sigma factor (sigma-70 family)